jgi:hypothetical protein
VVRLKERGSARGDYRRSGLTAAVDSKMVAPVTLRREGVDEWSWGILRRAAARFTRSWQEEVTWGKRERWWLCASRLSRYVSVINDNHLVSLINFNAAKVD